MKEFEQIIREKDAGFTMELREGAWDRMQQKLKQRKKRRFFFYLLAASLAVFPASYAIFNLNTDSGDTNTPVVTETIKNNPDIAPSSGNGTVARGNQSGQGIEETSKQSDNNQSASISNRTETKTGFQRAGNDQNKPNIPEFVSTTSQKPEWSWIEVPVDVHGPDRLASEPVLAFDPMPPVTSFEPGNIDSTLGDIRETLPPIKGYWSLGMWYEAGIGYRYYEEYKNEGIPGTSVYYPTTNTSNPTNAPDRSSNDKRSYTRATGISMTYSRQRWSLNTGLVFRQMGYLTHIRSFEFPDSSYQQNKEYEAYSENAIVPERKTTETEFVNRVYSFEIPLQLGFKVVNRQRWSAGLFAGASYKHIVNFDYVVWEPSEFVYYRFRGEGNGLNRSNWGISLGTEVAYNLSRHEWMIQPVYNADIFSAITDKRYEERLYNFGVRFGYRYHFK